MTDIEKAIADLLVPDGKPSPKMTHAVKFIGDGSMQNGFERIADYYTKVGERSGSKKGAIGGGIGGFAVATITFAIGVLIKNKIDKDKALEAEGTAILKGLEEGTRSDDDATDERNDAE